MLKNRIRQHLNLLFFLSPSSAVLVDTALESGQMFESDGFKYIKQAWDQGGTLHMIGLLRYTESESTRIPIRSAVNEVCCLRHSDACAVCVGLETAMGLGGC